MMKISSISSVTEITSAGATSSLLINRMTSVRNKWTKYNNPLPLLMKTAIGKSAYFIRSRACPGVFIEQSSISMFNDKTENDLFKISETKTGRKLFSVIANHCKDGKYIAISPSKNASSATPFLTAQQEEKYGKGQSTMEMNSIAADLCRKKWFLKAEGACAQIYYNQNLSLNIDDQGWPSANKDNPDDSFIALFHELVHATRILKGTSTNDGHNRYDPQTGSGKEELRAVGINKWAGHALSENSLRRELGKPLRLHYGQKLTTVRQESRNEPRFSFFSLLRR